MPVILMLLLLHALVGWRLMPELPAPAAWGMGLWLAASAVLMPLSFMRRRRRGRVHRAHGDRSAAHRSADGDTDAAGLMVWAGLLLMGAFSTLFVLTLLRDVLLAVVWAGQGMAVVAGLAGTAVSAFPLSSADLASVTAAAVPLLALAVTALGFYLARRRAPVVRVDVPLAGLPVALHGFTIVQITDVHVGPTIRHRHMRGIVDAVNGLRADMVAITGDLVDGSVADLRHHVSPLQDLASRHGTYFVTGNHEYYSGAHAWIAELQRLGVRVLMNEHVVLRHDGAALVVAGVADHSAHHFDAAHRSDPHAAVAGAPADAVVRVLLAHQPRSAPGAADAGFHLQLSGHTHGGQFWPWNHFVRLQQPFTAGLHRLREMWVYTSRGTGYWGPPKRLGAPSEITHLRLVCAPAGAAAARMLQSGHV